LIKLNFKPALAGFFIQKNYICVKLKHMAELVKIYNENPNERELDKVVKVLKEGGLIIYPTDTVYGLGCDITNTKAMEKVAQIKGVKLNKANFSFICHDLSNLSDYVKQIDTPTYKILKRALPGPFTFVLPSNTNLPKAFKGKKTVGIRIPNNNIIRELVKKLGNPIVSTSIYDEDDLIEYTTDPELIFEKWQNKVAIVIDGGYGGNIPSTVIELADGELTILREGKGNIEDI
jgi:tRNA threonylcarbamoyl adenosine modification protein (Sua5/YciO/YrdC/YwlC family)